MSVYELTGRRALVTGGAQGLGAGMAEALAQAGAAVVIGDVREDVGKTTAGSLQQSGATCEFVPLGVRDGGSAAAATRFVPRDVRYDASWDQAIAQAIGYLGGLDILVNNAGVEISSLLVDL